MIQLVDSLFLVLASLKATFNNFDRCHVGVYVPEIETGRHVKNNAYTVEIKIKMDDTKTHTVTIHICTFTVY